MNKGQVKGQVKKGQVREDGRVGVVGHTMEGGHR